MMAGRILAPWPNRLDGGAWLLGDDPQRLEVNEPERGNAIHGLLAHHRYDISYRDSSSIRLEAVLDARHGYPFQLRLAVEYQATDEGVRVRHHVTNLSEGRAPFALGAHPYLGIDHAPACDLEIRVRADAVLEVDDRLLPCGIARVGTDGSDLRNWTPVQKATPHACFAALEVSDGLIRHGIRRPGEAEVELWADPGFSYVQVYVTDGLRGLAPGELAIAIEPMTAPANALRSGWGLRWLSPDDTWSGEWGIRLVS